MITIPFYETDAAGCHADGSLGRAHVRTVLSDLVTDAVNYLQPGDHWSAMLTSFILRGAPTYKATEEESALHFLQRITAPGMTWMIDDDGSLYLNIDDES